MATNNINTIVKTMETNPVVIDNHTNKEEAITGLVEFNNSDNGLACCFDARYYSLNRCYIDNDEKLHCSTWSIGGVLWGPYPDAEALKEYNESCIYDSAKIKCIHRPDGTKVYPAA
jgi:hypothetical protein